MKKLKAKLKNARNTISISTYKRPRIFVILSMVFINIAILIIAAFIAMAIDPTISNFIDAFAYGSITWMLTPNAILSIEHPQTLFLAVTVLIIGLVLFSGTIIALTTNTIKDYFEKKQSASGRLHVQNHILILNWNNKVPELISDLVFVESRKVTILVLAKIDKKFAERAIQNAIKQTHKTTLKHLNVLVKNGDPLVKSELLDAAIEEASSIIIMSQDSLEPPKSTLNKSDLNGIKVLLSVAQTSVRKDTTLVVEVKAFETKIKMQTLNKNVRSLKNFNVIPVCFDRRLGQIMAQTIIDKTMEDIYLSLFSFDGSEVYALDNSSFEECLQIHSHALPIATLNDTVFVLSDNNKTKNIKGNKVTSDPLKTHPLKEKVKRDVYILGKNNKRDFIIESFEAYERLHKSTFNATWHDDEALEELVVALNASETDATLLLLSDDYAETDALDANVLHALLYLTLHLKRSNVDVIVELLDPKNDALVKDFNIENTIISNKIISLLLSKLALFPETEPFYDELLTIEPQTKGKDSEAVTIQRAKDLLDTAFPYKATSIKEATIALYYGSNKKLMLIGLKTNEETTIFSGNFEETPLIIHEDDQLICIKL